MRTVRKLVLGETWALPVGLALALAVTGLARVVAGAGGWFHAAGGFLLLGLVYATLAASLRRT